ncbi:MAG: glycosyltransferase family 2 protein [Cetobacterium sp.]
MNDVLVSVVVVTYNFEEVIVETLESIKEQTYTRLELVITDDNSTDKTIDICKKWIEKNKERFENIIVLENKINVGPTKNYNIGLKVANGKWLKYISDDIMTSTFIANSMNIVNNNSDIEILFSQSKSFFGKWKDQKFGGLFPENKDLFKYNLSSEEQFEYILEGCYVAAPTNFIKKSLLEEVGYCNEKYKFFEDYPLWIKILETGRRLYFNNEINLFYRRWEKSVSYNNNDYLNRRQVEFHRDYFNNEQKYKIKDKIKRFEKNLEIYRDEVIIKAGNKKQTFYSKMLRYLQPSRYKKKKYKYCGLFLILSLIFVLLRRI